ncbi:calmin isoform X1, partial [Clarias magur]
QIGQEILSNLHTDREKIQRSRDRLRETDANLGKSSRILSGMLRRPPAAMMNAVDLVEREVVQKRTFTRWMNLHLEKCNPPMMVHDLFRDIRDGRVLMALLEELSGCRLLHEFKPSAHRIFRLNNIARVLAFLEERNVKLVSIDATDVADGNSSIVLGLIWNIILFFQIKELTGNIRNQFPSSSSLSSIPTSSDSDMSQSSTPSDDKKPSVIARDHGKAIKTLLHWVQRRTRKFGVAVQDFGKSWTSGLAFLAVIKSIDPSLVDMRRALLRSPRENIEEAFRTAHYSLGIPRLLEPEDVMLNRPDQQSIMTYVSQFLEHFPGIEEDDPLDILERNKVSARMTEPPVKNGVQRKREKSGLVKRDWVQPPPKIFISSVVKEQEQKRSPVPLPTVDDRPWDSEDSSVASSPSTTENRPPSGPLGLNKDASSPLSSPQPSLIDSAMDFPESWPETPSEIPQSCSNDSLRDSTSAGDLTSLGSPLESERGLQDQVDSELIIDEGNFSLSLEARSALLSEEEDSYRYILDLKEEESASDAPSVDILQISNTQEPCPETNLDNPTSSDRFFGDCDSGYYPDQKEVSTTQPDDANKSSVPVSSSQPIAEDKNESKNLAENLEESLKPSTTEEVPKVTTESDLAYIFDDDQEWPVVQYERVSISGSEEDVEELGTELRDEPFDDEMEENPMPGVFSSGKEDVAAEESHHFRKTEVVEPEQDSAKPEGHADQICTEIDLPQILTDISHPGEADTGAEIQEKVDQTASGAEEPSQPEEPALKDLSESIQQVTDSLVDTNLPEVEEEKPESSPLKPFEENGENITRGDEPSQDDLGLVQDEAMAQSKSEEELNVTQSLPVSELVPQSRTIEDECEDENVEQDDASSDSLQNISDAKAKDDALIESNTSSLVSPSSQSNALVPDVSTPEITDEPNPGAPSCETEEALSSSPPTPGTVDQLYEDKNEGHATWEQTKILDAERAERCRAELRLSLSVTPLQRAPSQPALTDSDSAQEKVDYGVVESPGQSPFSLWVSHPGEWGLVETDLDAEIERNNREERKSREEPENEVSTSAREDNPDTPSHSNKEEAARERSTEDENQPPVVVEPEVVDVKGIKFNPEIPRENGETPAAITAIHTDE